MTYFGLSMSVRRRRPTFSRSCQPAEEARRVRQYGRVSTRFVRSLPVGQEGFTQRFFSDMFLESGDPEFRERLIARAQGAGTRHSLRPLFCWANGLCKNSDA